MSNTDLTDLMFDMAAAFRGRVRELVAQKKELRLQLNEARSERDKKFRMRGKALAKFFALEKENAELTKKLDGFKNGLVFGEPVHEFWESREKLRNENAELKESEQRTSGMYFARLQRHEEAQSRITELEREKAGHLTALDLKEDRIQRLRKGAGDFERACQEWQMRHDALRTATNCDHAELIQLRKENTELKQDRTPDRAEIVKLSGAMAELERERDEQERRAKHFGDAVSRMRAEIDDLTRQLAEARDKRNFWEEIDVQQTRECAVLGVENERLRKENEELKAKIGEDCEFPPASMYRYGQSYVPKSSRDELARQVEHLTALATKRDNRIAELLGECARLKDLAYESRREAAAQIATLSEQHEEMHRQLGEAREDLSRLTSGLIPLFDAIDRQGYDRLSHVDSNAARVACVVAEFGELQALRERLGGEGKPDGWVMWHPVEGFSIVDISTAKWTLEQREYIEEGWTVVPVRLLRLDEKGEGEKFEGSGVDGDTHHRCESVDGNQEPTTGESQPDNQASRFNSGLPSYEQSSRDDAWKTYSIAEAFMLLRTPRDQNDIERASYVIEARMAERGKAAFERGVRLAWDARVVVVHRQHEMFPGYAFPDADAFLKHLESVDQPEWGKVLRKEDGVAFEPAPIPVSLLEAVGDPDEVFKRFAEDFTEEMSEAGATAEEIARAVELLRELEKIIERFSATTGDESDE